MVAKNESSGLSFNRPIDWRNYVKCTQQSWVNIGQTVARVIIIYVAVHDLLDETQQLVASIEAAAVDGINGNYVARISTAMNNIQANIDSCPSINMARDKVDRIKELEENCPVEHIDEYACEFCYCISWILLGRLARCRKACLNNKKKFNSWFRGTR